MDGCDDEAIAQAMDSSRASPDMCRTGDLKNDREDRFSTLCWQAVEKQPDRAAMDGCDDEPIAQAMNSS